MKNKLNKSILFFIGLFAIFTCTSKVEALTFNRGTPSKNDNIVTVPLSFDIAEGDNITGIKIDCETSNLDVTCEIHKKDSYNEAVFTDFFMKPIGATYFRTGNHDVFIIQLTNNSNKEENVTVSLKSSEYETETGTHKIELPSFETTISPKLSSNPKASDIHFSQGKMVPAFNPEITDYTVYSIQDTINSVNAFYTCQDASTCTDSGWSGGKSVSGSKITLNQGENRVSIELTSEDGQNRITYSFKIIRGETVFNSSKLSSIEVGTYNLTPSFSKNVIEYSFQVPYKIDSVKEIIKFTPEDDQANSIIEGGEGLIIGENIVKIVVDNSNGDESTTYTIKVTRKNPGAIEVTNYKNNIISFTDDEGVKNTLGEEEFKIQYAEEYEKIKNGTYKFNANGERVTEEQPTTKKVETPKKEEKKDDKLYLIIGLVVAGLIIIIISGILIFKHKPKDKKNSSAKEIGADTQEIDETGIEEKIIKEQKKSDFEETQDIDEALSDLMSTKQYNLSDFTDQEDSEQE